MPVADGTYRCDVDGCDFTIEFVTATRDIERAAINDHYAARHPASAEHWVYDDGGRQAAGFRGSTGDCVCRAIAIVTSKPYIDVYNELNELAQRERRRNGRKRSSARTGIHKPTTRRYLASLGLTWTPTMQIGSGCTVHLRADELPAGRLVVQVSGHITAVIDGVIHDTHDPGRAGTRCVYGYWSAL